MKIRATWEASIARRGAETTNWVVSHIEFNSAIHPSTLVTAPGFQTSTDRIANGVVTGHECNRPALSRSRTFAGIHPAQDFIHNIMSLRMRGQKKRRRTSKSVL